VDPLIDRDAAPLRFLDGAGHHLRGHVADAALGLDHKSACSFLSFRSAPAHPLAAPAKFLADRVDGYLDRVSGNLSVVVMKLAADTKSVGTTTEYACKARAQVGISQPLE
jgi:hypothetical protein